MSGDFDFGDGGFFFWGGNNSETTFVDLIILILILASIAFAVSQCTPRDDTDPVDGGRSGLGLYTDAKTGCQYVTHSGGISPRLDTNGKQICGAVK